MKKSAEDMELSCDETVLLNADEYTRKKYASLLLDAAGDDRGFTTCLSASAKTMHYRLKSITKPAKRRSGALVVGAVFFLLCMTSGYVALMKEGTAYGNDFPAGLSRLWKAAAGGKELVFDAEYPEGAAHHGIYGDRVYERYTEMRFDFSNELAAPCSVLVESWDRKNSETFTQQDITQPFIIPLPQYAAHYTICASVYGPNRAVCEAEYQFDLGEI